MPEIQYIDLHTFSTNFGIKASELWARKAHKQDISDIEALIYWVRKDILKFSSGTLFQFTIDGKIVEPTWVVFKEQDAKNWNIDYAFAARYPYHLGDPAYRLEYDSDSQGDSTPEPVNPLLDAARSIKNFFQGKMFDGFNKD